MKAITENDIRKFFTLKTLPNLLVCTRCRQTPVPDARFNRTYKTLAAAHCGCGYICYGAEGGGRKLPDFRLDRLEFVAGLAGPQPI